MGSSEACQSCYSVLVTKKTSVLSRHRPQPHHDPSARENRERCSNIQNPEQLSDEPYRRDVNTQGVWFRSQLPLLRLGAATRTGTHKSDCRII
eukprot:579749-Rhodomonas_salina.1